VTLIMLEIGCVQKVLTNVILFARSAQGQTMATTATPTHVGQPGPLRLQAQHWTSSGYKARAASGTHHQLLARTFAMQTRAFLLLTLLVTQALGFSLWRKPVIDDLDNLPEDQVLSRPEG
jgi:hypothetical protein